MSDARADAATYLEALRGSIDRLRELADRFDDDTLTQPAYPSEWSVADVLSHLGSGAVITTRRL
ncbi:maleylpyruvate isomerase N-terminal domain-containing protein [Nocardioides sp. GCM10028917]|uniref:maleylpyruvate isomerase N-terminal domain-containing protein n=1 Tax=Nocardioides sp. GCM10028917 TaxID=3273408 RepID=UPI00360DF97E